MTVGRSFGSILAARPTERVMGDFTKLSVWQKAHAVTLAVYRVTAEWPKHEMFTLTSQARRAAISVPANIAEGCGKNSDGALARYARDSLGSASELVVLPHPRSRPQLHRSSIARRVASRSLGGPPNAHLARTRLRDGSTSSLARSATAPQRSGPRRGVMRGYRRHG